MRGHEREGEGGGAVFEVRCVCAFGFVGELGDGLGPRLRRRMVEMIEKNSAFSRD